MRRRVESQSILRRYRKQTVVILGAFLIVGGYVLWSVVVWRHYHDQYVTAIAQSKADIDTALALPQSTEDEKGKKIDTLIQIANSYQALDCQVPSLAAWQTIFGGLQTEKDSCEDSVARLSDLITVVRSNALYLDDERKLVAAMVTEEVPDAITEDTLESQVAIWREMLNAVDSLEVSEAFVPVKDEASKSVSAIYTTWQQLFDAHKAQDQEAYEQARTQLSESYDTLAAITLLGSKQLVPLTKKLQTSYDQAFQ